MSDRTHAEMKLGEVWEHLEKASVLLAQVQCTENGYELLNVQSQEDVLEAFASVIRQRNRLRRFRTVR